MMGETVGTESTGTERGGFRNYGIGVLKTYTRERVTGSLQYHIRVVTVGEANLTQQPRLRTSHHRQFSAEVGQIDRVANERIIDVGIDVGLRIGFLQDV